MQPNIQTAQDFQIYFKVSDDIMAHLLLYATQLVKWQKAINLVSPSTLKSLWGRHFADSAQLVGILPEGAKNVVDIGSGAGFPALVMAIMMPNLEFCAIESDQRKAQFLKSVSRETAPNFIVVNDRIENVRLERSPDIVTARALASLGGLLKYADMWSSQNKNLNMIFLKGENAGQEIDEAKKSYDFDLETFPSISHLDAKVLLIKNCVKR